MSEKIIEETIENIMIKGNGLDQELYENRLRTLLSEKFRIQKGIKKAVEDNDNNLWLCNIGLNPEPPIWKALKKVKKIQNKIDIIVEALKRISKMERN